MLTRSFMKKHIISFSVLLFVAIYLIINHIKPSFLYTNEGTLRQFGLGYKNKTVIPLWLIAIIAAIIVILKAVIIAIGSIPPPFTVPFGFLFPIAQIVETIEDIVDAFAAILIESLPQALADLGNMVIKTGLTIIALIGAINTLLATLDFIRKVLESLYLKYLNTCNIGDNSNDGTIVDGIHVA